MTRRTRILITALTLLALAVVIRPFVPEWMVSRLVGKKTVNDRLQQYGQAARARLQPHFARTGVAYPPQRLVIVGLKREKQLQIYAAGTDNKLHFIHQYPILAASGGPGPKLRYGDGQVPEGIYPIESLNPNSSYHLSLRIGYPNAFDRQMAVCDNRDNLGGDIMIHGKSVSIGCLAIGDEPAEDLFVLAADTGRSHIKVILTPYDFRTSHPQDDLHSQPKWVSELYSQIRAEMKKLPA